MFCFFIINVRHQANMLLPLRLFLDMEISLSLTNRTSKFRSHWTFLSNHFSQLLYCLKIRSCVLSLFTSFFLFVLGFFSRLEKNFFFSFFSFFTFNTAYLKIILSLHLKVQEERKKSLKERDEGRNKLSCLYFFLILVNCNKEMNEHKVFFIPTAA